MYAFPLPAALLAAAPGVAATLGIILGNLAALVARAFLRHPHRVAVIVPLWNYIGRTARRLARALATIDTPRRSRASRPGRPSGKPPIALPRARGWLVADLRHEAAGYGSQLRHLLETPEAAALFQASPHARRLLRPICHMLGIMPAARTLPRRVPAATAPANQAARPAQPPGALESWCAPARGEVPPRPAVPSASLCPRLADRWPFNQLKA